ncbi:hypothetical protein EVAR_74531_1 [Eumeta japonica]|uniref:Uncharacterized protein n=1 Tax=Eumeta variegata TaxID=151549 RepID=A0A4C1TBK8_EUMVA|nr:hypothetical protein EVAR_74531_1 [Eumeta japonica]
MGRPRPHSRTSGNNEVGNGVKQDTFPYDLGAFIFLGSNVTAGYANGVTAVVFIAAAVITRTAPAVIVRSGTGARNKGFLGIGARAVTRALPGSDSSINENNFDKRDVTKKISSIAKDRSQISTSENESYNFTLNMAIICDIQREVVALRNFNLDFKKGGDYVQTVYLQGRSTDTPVPGAAAASPGAGV